MYFLKRVLSWASGINWRPFFSLIFCGELQIVETFEIAA